MRISTGTHDRKQAEKLRRELLRDLRRGDRPAPTKPIKQGDLRRSFGQRLADAGVLPRDLQIIMRHKHFSTTEKYYLRHTASDQAIRIASALGYAAPNRTQENSDQESKQESS